MSSDDVNYLVYRYLLESGFSHSAFTFAHESLVARTVVSDSDIPPGALLSFLQKGLQYVEIESHLQEVRYIYGEGFLLRQIIDSCCAASHSATANMPASGHSGYRLMPHSRARR